MGAISSVGHNSQQTFDSLVAGQSGIGRISLFDPSNLQCQVAGEVKGFDPADYMNIKMARRIGRYAQFSIAATQEALAQSGLVLDNEDLSRIACVVSSAIGDFPMVEQQMYSFFHGKRRTISPFTVPRVSTSMAAGNIALEYGLTGASFGLSSACATGSHSLANALMLLKLGMADVVASSADGPTTGALFIDEGFGSLDAQSLDHAIDVLDRLRGRGALVGLITHVETLKAALPVGIEVRPLPGGRGSELIQNL